MSVGPFSLFTFHAGPLGDVGSSLRMTRSCQQLSSELKHKQDRATKQLARYLTISRLGQSPAPEELSTWMVTVMAKAAVVQNGRAY